MHPTVPLVISAPYPEGAVRSIAGAAVAASTGTLVYASGGVPQRAIDLAVRFHVVTDDLGRRVARRAQFSDAATEIAHPLEVARLLTRLSRSWRAQRWWMHRAAALFDRAVARRLRGREVGAVLAMPGAAEATFRAVADRGGRCMFHAVNAHPTVHNERLRDAYGSRAELEMLPSAVVDRVMRELELATTVLVPSHLVAAQMTSHGIAPDRIVRVPYGAPATDSTYPSASRRPGTRPLVLFVGQVGYRKGVPFLLEAARGLDVDVQLVGPVVAPRVLDRLPANVEHLGAVSSEEVAKRMATADAFVLPTVEDACALVIAEAAIRGLPVITTDQNGAAELLGEREVTIVPSADAFALRSALADVDVLADDDRAARRERVRSDGGILTWTEYGNEVLQRCGIEPDEVDGDS